MITKILLGLMALLMMVGGMVLAMKTTLAIGMRIIPMADGAISLIICTAIMSGGAYLLLWVSSPHRQAG